METYYLTLRPSSLNVLYNTIAKASTEITNGTQIFPTKGSIILLSFSTNNPRTLGEMVNILNDWTIDRSCRYISDMELINVDNDISRTLLLNVKLSKEFQEMIQKLISKIKLTGLIRESQLITNYPCSIIVYRGVNDISNMRYLEDRLISYNRQEWLITISKAGSAPLYIKDRIYHLGDMDTNYQQK